MKTNIKFIVVCVIVSNLYLAFAVSCGNAKSFDNTTIHADTTVAEKRTLDTVKLVSSLEELYSYCPKYTVIETCDLSYLGLKEIPVLSLYNIKRLNLSHNEFRKVQYIDFLPTSLEELNISYCNIGLNRTQDYERIEKFSDVLFWVPVVIKLSAKEFPRLRKLDVSYNRIESVKVPKYTQVIDMHFNDSKGVKNEVREREKYASGINPDTVKSVKSLEELYELTPTTVIELCDLSNQGLKSFPVLRPYNIKRLNISGNDFRKFNHEGDAQKKIHGTAARKPCRTRYEQLPFERRHT